MLFLDTFVWPALDGQVRVAVWKAAFAWMDSLNKWRNCWFRTFDTYILILKKTINTHDADCVIQNKPVQLFEMCVCVNRQCKMCAHASNCLQTCLPDNVQTILPVEVVAIAAEFRHLKAENPTFWWFVYVSTRKWGEEESSWGANICVVLKSIATLF